MKEEETYKKNQQKGTTKDRQAWFQLIKILRTVWLTMYSRSEKDTVFAARNFEIQWGVICIR